MAVKFDSIVVGEILFDVHKERMGNTTMSVWDKWDVEIISIDKVKRTAQVSWNGNSTEIYCERDLMRLYRKEPKGYRDQQERRKRGCWL